MKRIIVTKDGWLSGYAGKPGQGGIVMLILADASVNGWSIEYRP